jgi:hypothetical protein
MLTQCKVLLLMMENLSSKLNHDEILSLVGGNKLEPERQGLNKDRRSVHASKAFHFHIGKAGSIYSFPHSR